MRSRRRIVLGVLAGGVLAAVATARPAAAENEPVIVVPGRAGVPVMMYGMDVSGAVIEGEWGLNRPGVVAPTVIMHYWPHEINEMPSGYYPATGRRPRSGRLEINPPANRRLPPRAEPYYREWWSESAPGPATQQTQTPVNMPIVVAPQISRGRQQGPPHHTP